MSLAVLEIVDPQLQEAVHVYCRFMEEVKMRLGAIQNTVKQITADPKGPDSILQCEFAYLQLRYVCELLALSALAAQKPYGLTDVLLESFHARRALNDLSEINGNCFPRPVKITRADGKISLDVSDIGALKRKELQRIYDKLGSRLHRGRFRQAFEGKPPVYDIKALDRWARKIGSLLSHHAMMLLDHGLILVVHLTSGPNGSVQIAISKSDGPAIYVPPTETPSGEKAA